LSTPTIVDNGDRNRKKSKKKSLQLNSSKGFSPKTAFFPPEYDRTPIPSEWLGDRQFTEPKHFSQWLALQLRGKTPENKRRWLLGYVISSIEHQVREEIGRGVALIHMRIPLAPGLSHFAASEAIDRIEADGLVLPSIILECAGGQG
jgi:hypothetical protein